MRSGKMKKNNSRLKPTTPPIYYYGKQSINNSDVEAVAKTLLSSLITQGPVSQQFEHELSAYFGARHTSVVANGTAGLHLIALGLGWKQNDLVITTPITFLASANCAIYAGADVDFVDIDSSSYTIDPNKLEDKIIKLSKSKKRIKAVVAVDYAGHPCDWKSLHYLKEKYGFQLVNDFCHALGAEYKNSKHYAAKYADAVNLSFHPVKHITTGEGGAILTNDDELDKSIKTLRTHGMTKDPEILLQNDGPWYYEMHEVGYNYRITDFQCALGINQLKKLDGFLVERRKVAQHYNEAFANIDTIKIPKISKGVKHAYHLYPLLIDFKKLKIDKLALYNNLKNDRVVFQVHYIPVHLQPYYKNRYGYKRGDFPVAENFYDSEISIPIYPGLKKADLNYISKTIIKNLG